MAPQSRDQKTGDVGKCLTHIKVANCRKTLKVQKFFAQKNQLKAKNKEPDFFITGKRNNMQRHIKVK